MNTKVKSESTKNGNKIKANIRKNNNSRKKDSCKQRINSFLIYQFVMQTSIVIKRHFPELMELLSNVHDYRQRPQYEVQELLMAVIAMFLFKRGSRNSMDNTMKKGLFAKNLESIFACSFPDLDTSNKLLKILSPEELELIKHKLISRLIVRKVLNKFRVFGLYYVVAIDGTGVQSFDKEPYPECPYKVSKNGVYTWMASVLEAKIVCSNGFSFSIATEWLKNPANKEFDKQDCELKAFARLADKLKTSYPRLPIIIAADGLYPNKTVFDICKNNNWNYIITLKDGNLKSIWEEIESLKKIGGVEENKKYRIDTSYHITENYTFINDLEYKNKYNLNVVEATVNKKHKKNDSQKKEYFAHITDIPINKSNCSLISHTGRLRWKIENEGFNEQKNGGYNLQHKYSRTSFNASQNYYQCLQIAHIINQLAHKSSKIKDMIVGNDSIKSFMECAMALIMWQEFENNILQGINANCQFRY
jgi:hypothetical protein